MFGDLNWRAFIFIESDDIAICPEARRAHSAAGTRYRACRCLRRSSLPGAHTSEDMKMSVRKGVFCSFGRGAALASVAAMVLAASEPSVAMAGAASATGLSASHSTGGNTDISAARRYHHHHGGGAAAMAAFAGIVGTIGGIAAAQERRDYYDGGPGYYDGGPAHYGVRAMATTAAMEHQTRITTTATVAVDSDPADPGCPTAPYAAGGSSLVRSPIAAVNALATAFD